MYNILMEYKKIEKYLIWVVKASLYVVVFAPVIIASQYFFPVIFPKAVFIRLLVELMFVAYIPLIIIAPQYRPKYSIIYVTLIVFAIIVFITSLTGVNFSYSFWGNYERMDGVFSWMHYWALLVIAASVLKQKKDWLILFGFSILAATLVSTYGFFQRVGIQSFLGITIFETGSNRITGTIGNPAFLGVYLSFHLLFLMIFIVAKSISVKLRVLAGLFFAVILYAFILTGVRGAFLGLIAGVAFFTVGYLFWVQSGYKWIKHGLLISAAVLLVLMSTLFAFRQEPWVKNNQIFGRFFNIRLSDSTVQTRIISWEGALKGTSEFFWLGTGPQKFDVVFNKYFDPRFYSLVGSETWWDRAHNMIIEAFVTMGIFGLLSYLSVGLALLYVSYRMGKDSKHVRIESLLIMAFLIGYLIQNLFVFDSISSYLMIAVLVGYVVARSAEIEFAAEARFFDKIKLKSKYLWTSIFGFSKKVSAQYWWIGLVAALLGVGPIAYAHNAKLITHNKLILNQLARGNKLSLTQSLNAYREIFATSSFDEREAGIKLAQYMGSYALGNQMTIDELKQSFGYVIKTLDGIVDRNPKDVRLIMSYGNSVNVYGELLRQAKDEKAESVLRKAESMLLDAVELGPARQQVFYSLANTYLILGNEEKAISVLKDAIQIHKETAAPHWILSLIYIRTSQANEAVAEARRALDLNYVFNSEQEAQPMAQLLLENEDLDLLLRLYERVAGTVANGSAQAKYAALLAQLGFKEEAVKAARIVLDHDPSLLEDVNEFIKKVESGEEADFMGN